MKKKTNLFLVLLLTFALFSVANAQESVSPEKKKLILELLKVDGSERMPGLLFENYMAMFEQTVGSLVEGQANADKTLSPKQKAEVVKVTKEIFDRALPRFRREIPSSLKLDDKMIGVFIDEYNANFTEEELKDLITFFKGSTGRKYVNWAYTNQLLLTEKLMEAALEQIEPLKEKIIDEEGEKVRAEIQVKSAAKPTSKPKNRRRN